MASQNTLALLERLIASGADKETIAKALAEERAKVETAHKYEKLGISATSGTGKDKKTGKDIAKTRKVQVKLPNAWPAAFTLDNWKRLKEMIPIILDAHKDLLTAEEIRAQETDTAD